MSDATLRILHVTASLSPVRGGTTSSIVTMIVGLEATGIECEVALSDDDGPGKRLAQSAPERQLPNRHYFTKRRDLYVHTPDMGPWLDEYVSAYDVVHIHGLFSHVNGLAGRICRRRQVPYVVTPHGMANRYGLSQKPFRKALSLALIERPLLKGAAVIHMTSRSEQLDFNVLGIGTPVTRIPLAVEPPKPGNPHAFWDRYPETRDRSIAVCFGRLDPIKNFESIIDALALPGAEGWHLVVGGDGPEDYEQALKNRSKSCGVSDRITWLGFVSGAIKEDALAAAHVYVQLSFSESFGMAALEAVSAGLPCILGKGVAIAADLVKAGFGIVVPPTSVGAAISLNSAASLKANDPTFVKRAEKFVIDRFHRSVVACELQAMYKFALDRQKCGTA